MANIPGPILDCLRCIKCRGFLSCGPVSVLAGGESLCGRCTVIGPNTFRALPYEAVAVYFLFPCKYWQQHCAYFLNWNEVIGHEADCVFKSTCRVMCQSPGSLFKPDNKLNLNEAIIVFNVPEALLQTLTCTVCEYYLSSSPIFIDSSGVGMCHRCYKSREHIPSGFVRHLALEKILQIMLFPCIYRYRGCVRHFRFGLDTTAHEDGCSYGKVQRKTPKTFTEGTKQKGVIETHSGHMFGTITPNSQFFSAQGKVPYTTQYSGTIEPIKVIPTEEQGVFFNQLIKHRDNLENKWRSSKMEQISTNPESTISDNEKYSKQNSPSSTIGREDSFRSALAQTPSYRHQSSYTNEIDRTPSARQQFTFTERGPSPSDSYKNPAVHRPQSYSDVERNPSVRKQSYTEIPRNSSVRQQSPYRPLHSQSSKSDSPNSTLDGYPNQLQPSTLNNDLMYANSFSHFDRFEKGAPPAQRSESLYTNQNDPRNHSINYYEDRHF